MSPIWPTGSITSFRVGAVVAAYAAAVTGVRVALETAPYGQSALSQADVEDEWLGRGRDCRRDDLRG
jgi:hypothetical protein